MSPMSVLRRPGLLLSAAMTITVPSVLATLAVVGHEHAIQEARATAVSLGADAPPASLPSGSESAVRPAVLAGSSAGRDAAAAHAAIFDAVVNQQHDGMRLLGKAATAGLNTSYQGVELIAQSGVTGTLTMISSVWHRGGGLTVTQTSDATVLAGSQPYVAYAGDGNSPEGVFGVTKPLVTLLGKNYIAMFTGKGSAVGRPAFIVELDRADGSLAARFWLDSKTLVPLRRDVFDTSAQLVSEDAFVQVQFGPLAAPPSATRPVSSQWSRVAAPAKLLLDLDGQGWQLPATLPGGLALYDAAQSKSGAGQVVDLGYSDGLSVISLFVERGTLGKMSGWQPVSVRGHVVYVAEHSITWAGPGFVYTMIADAPPKTVEQVVAALPQSSAPGFLDRLGRGLDRLASLMNPFH